jgi:hypothetical protein
MRYVATAAAVYGDAQAVLVQMIEAVKSLGLPVAA